jgi:hypothetical protein
VKHVAAVDPVSCPEAVFEHLMAFGKHLQEAAVFIAIGGVCLQRRNAKLLIVHLLASTYKIQETSCLDEKTIINVGLSVFHVVILSRKTLPCFAKFSPFNQQIQFV